MEGNYSLADIAAATNNGGYGPVQQEILYNQHFNSLDNKMDKIGYGIADATYALNNVIAGEGRSIQMQIADCCCTNQKGIADLKYDMAQNTQKVLDAIAQNKVEALQAQVNQLQLQQALCGIPKISNYGYGVTPNFCQGGCCGYVA